MFAFADKAKLTSPSLMSAFDPTRTIDHFQLAPLTRYDAPLGWRSNETTGIHPVAR